MKMRDMAFMAMGMGAVLAYQKYNKPVMKEMKKMVNSAKDLANEKLENMM